MMGGGAGGAFHTAILPERRRVHPREASERENRFSRVLSLQLMCFVLDLRPSCRAASKDIVQRTSETMGVGPREPWRTRTGASSSTLHMMSPLSGARRATRDVALLQAPARAINARWRRADTVSSRHRRDPVSSAQAKQ